MRTMPYKRPLWAVLCLVSATGIAYGCSSSSAPVTNPNPDSGSSHMEGGSVDGPRGDAHPADAAPTDAGPDGPQICNPDKPLAEVPWAPPTPFHQDACTSAQIALYLSDFAADDTAAFRGDSANASCVACIETSATAKKYGPVILGTVTQTNFGGCVANIDGDASSTGCGALINAYQVCAYQECGDCTDFGSGGPETVDCLKKAIAKGGSCASVWGTKPEECNADLSTGATSVCGVLSSFLSTWCGPTSTDGGSDAADGSDG
jgi:hypothetical protein